MIAHNTDRNNYAQIANEMFLDSKASVIMGCGAPDYNKDGEAITPTDYSYVGGEDTWNELLTGNVTDFTTTTINGN